MIDYFFFCHYIAMVFTLFVIINLSCDFSIELKRFITRDFCGYPQFVQYLISLLAIFPLFGACCSYFLDYPTVKCFKLGAFTHHRSRLLQSFSLRSLLFVTLCLSVLYFLKAYLGIFFGYPSSGLLIKCLYHLCSISCDILCVVHFVNFVS